MKQIITGLLLLTLSVSAFAQKDKGLNSIAIPQSKNPDVELVPKKEAESRFQAIDFSPSIYDENKPLTFPKENKSFEIGANNASVKKEVFANPREIPKNALPKNHGDENTKVFRRNQSFGEFKTKSAMVKILYRDHMAEDGDMVKIYINNMVVVAQVQLINNFRTVEIGLTPGFNKIEFEALNQGTSGPNTAEFHVFDDKGNQITANQWDLATGFKGSVMIIKE
ncbi:hypothetical protein ABGT15_05425 [Flavobacterium enshiense]|uniref:hypothetical protein n=1 Tax=Flavobacterium enshiense TaxID=1341165 RepID=UPI00345C7DA3